MRWIIGAFLVAAFAGLPGAGHAVTPGAVSTAVESARESTALTQEVARRRDHRRHYRRHHRHMGR